MQKKKLLINISYLLKVAKISNSKKNFLWIFQRFYFSVLQTGDALTNPIKNIEFGFV